MSLAGSWCISGEVTLPICSPLYEGHVGLVKLEISSGISLKLHLDSKLQLPCYGIVKKVDCKNAQYYIPTTAFKGTTETSI